MCIRDRHPEVKHTKRLNIHYARMGEPTWNANVLLHAISVKTVSYTHLDVYKRQALDGIDRIEVKKVRKPRSLPGVFHPYNHLVTYTSLILIIQGTYKLHRFMYRQRAYLK